MKLKDIKEARRRISPHVCVSSLAESRYLGGPSAFRLWLKLENLQPTGSFKVRPAFNNLLARLKEARARGVIAASSGNFAQAVAYASSRLSVRSKIVMIRKSSPFKVERTKAYGGEVVFSGNSYAERAAMTDRLVKETKGLLCHPFDSELTIAGDGTLGLELVEQLDGNFCVVVPISGGGLLAGIAFAVKSLNPKAEVYGVQPAGNRSMRASLKAGKPVDVGPVSSVADALIASKPGETGFELIQKYVDDVVSVPEEAIMPAVRSLAEMQKLVIEPGAVIPIVALSLGIIKSRKKNVVCIVSGGNVDLCALAGHPGDETLGARG